MTRNDIAIIRRAVEIAPNVWTYDGAEAEAWMRTAQIASTETLRNEAYLISGTLQLLNTADSAVHMQRTPTAEARLTATKPTQADLDTAARVLHWLSDHAQYFPEEYATIGDPRATETITNFCRAADACGVAVEDLVTTTADLLARDTHNQQS